MTTEEKIKEILTNYGCDLDNSYPESKAIKSIQEIILAEKIKILEGLEYVKHEYYPGHYSYSINKESIDYKISQLREEGKEKV